MQIWLPRGNGSVAVSARKGRCRWSGRHNQRIRSNAATHPAIWERLEEADQLVCCSIGFEREGQRNGAVPASQSGACNGAPALLELTSHGP